MTCVFQCNYNFGGRTNQPMRADFNGEEPMVIICVHKNTLALWADFWTLSSVNAVLNEEIMRGYNMGY